MNDIKISVIVPVYNAEDSLKETLDSVLGSTHSNIEIILVNDGSSDGSVEICNEYERKDKRVRVIHKENHGVSAARNDALNIATGDWISFLDADDKVESDIYEYMLDAATRYGADIVQCAVYFDNGDKSDIIYSPGRVKIARSTGEMTRSFFKYFALSNWSKLYKRELATAISFDTSLTIGEDLRYNLDALALSKKTVLLPDAKYHYVQRDGSACYSKISKQRLTSFSSMARQSSEDFADYPNITRFIFAEAMKNHADIASKIVLSGSPDYSDIFSDIRREIKHSFFKMLFSIRLGLKIKVKLTLIALFPKIYARLLIKSK